MAVSRCVSRRFGGLMFAAFFTFFAAALPAQAVPDDCVCPAYYKAVCGNDCVTYDNDCFARCGGATSVQPGECPKDCIEVSDQDPVPEHPCAAVLCPADYTPVCGSDCVTYSNECLAKCALVPSITPGECPKDCVPAGPTNGNGNSGNGNSGNGNGGIVPPGGAVPGRGNVTYYNHTPSANDTDPYYGEGGEPVVVETCVCTEVYQPVCGSDCKTYGNRCRALQCAKVDSITRRECPKDCVPKGSPSGGSTPAPVPSDAGTEKEPRITPSPQVSPCAAITCSTDYTPVCGSDCVTYSNECLAKCQPVDSFTPGECPKDCVPGDPNQCVCTEEYAPVCGDNCVTYSNECNALKCAKVTSITRGECPKDCVPKGSDSNAGGGGSNSGDDAASCSCTKERRPVCGRDCVTYGNPCMATKCAKVDIVSEGECSSECVPTTPKPQCECEEGAEKEPVCAVNLCITYDSPCLAQCAGVHNFTRGECPKDCVFNYDAYGYEVDKEEEEEEPVCPCSRELWPVCGSDCVTYNNPCLAKCARVESYKAGACPRSCVVSETNDEESPGVCTWLYSPVCGTGNCVTYSNACFAALAKVTAYKPGECPRDCKPTTPKSICKKAGRSCSASKRNDCCSGLTCWSGKCAAKASGNRRAGHSAA